MSTSTAQYPYEYGQAEDGFYVAIADRHGDNQLAMTADKETDIPIRAVDLITGLLFDCRENGRPMPMPAQMAQGNATVAPSRVLLYRISLHNLMLKQGITDEALAAKLQKQADHIDALFNSPEKVVEADLHAALVALGERMVIWN